MATHYLWYEVEELPGAALRVRRVARPAGALILHLWLTAWFGFGFWGAGAFHSLLHSLLFVFAFVSAGGLVLCATFSSLGIGAEEWRVEREALVVRRQLFGWAWERRFRGATLRITERRDLKAHTLSLSVHEPKRTTYLLNLNGPKPEQHRQLCELGKRLARATGWRLR